MYNTTRVIFCLFLSFLFGCAQGNDPSSPRTAAIPQGVTGVRVLIQTSSPVMTVYSSSKTDAEQNVEQNQRDIQVSLKTFLTRVNSIAGPLFSQIVKSHCLKGALSVIAVGGKPANNVSNTALHGVPSEYTLSIRIRMPSAKCRDLSCTIKLNFFAEMTQKNQEVVWVNTEEFIFDTRETKNYAQLYAKYLERLITTMEDEGIFRKPA